MPTTHRHRTRTSRATLNSSTTDLRLWILPPMPLSRLIKLTIQMHTILRKMWVFQDSPLTRSRWVRQDRGQVYVTHCGGYSPVWIPAFIHSKFLNLSRKCKDKHRLQCRIIARILLNLSRDSRRCAMITFQDLRISTDWEPGYTPASAAATAAAATRFLWSTSLWPAPCRPAPTRRPYPTSASAPAPAPTFI
jgi:hypothetical protein